MTYDEEYLALVLRDLIGAGCAFVDRAGKACDDEELSGTLLAKWNEAEKHARETLMRLNVDKNWSPRLVGARA